MITRSFARWAIFVVSIVAALLAFAMFIQPDKFAGKTDGIHFVFAALFIVDGLAVLIGVP